MSGRTGRRLRSARAPGRPGRCHPAGVTRCRDRHGSHDRRASRRRSGRRDRSSPAVSRPTPRPARRRMRPGHRSPRAATSKRHRCRPGPAVRMDRWRTIGGQVEEPARTVRRRCQARPVGPGGHRPGRAAGRSDTRAPACRSGKAAGSVDCAAAIGPPFSAPHGGGVQGVGAAPRVAAAAEPRAPSAITPGPTQRTHRDSNTIELLRRDVVAGGGRGDDGGRPHVSGTDPGDHGPTASRGPPGTGRQAPVARRCQVREGRVVLRSARQPVSRRVVAKPVRFRHSPATVNAPQGAEVRSPTSRCMLEPSRER